MRVPKYTTGKRSKKDYELEVQDCHYDGAKKQTRASLKNPNQGGKYIHTIATVDVWENAHFHGDAVETYILESGEAVLVQMKDGAAQPKQLTRGEAVSLPRNTHHKVWMKQGAKMHTVKAAAGAAEDARFRESPELETLCDKTGLDNLLVDAGCTPTEAKPGGDQTALRSGAAAAVARTTEPSDPLT
ncbi:MAG: hypothetical protein JKY37_02705 [Nannocystaceae bacterium]|nr:hypothetical protein [Nannocystaceae bacterium]